MFCDHCGADNIDTAPTCFACQHPLDTSPPIPTVSSTRGLLANNTLLKGRYRIMHSIGQGGFGSVYKAEDTQQQRYVAVKETDLSRLQPQEIIEATDAFNREVKILSQLHHPNLPTLYDNFTDPDHWYLIIDFIAGETLERYLEQTASSGRKSQGILVQDVLRIGIQLCTVLDYMHKHSPPIIFRDLKPANVMLAPSQRAHLIDFGIARQFKPGQARDTIAFGSPGYAAPEQYGKAQTTPRSDIYSLGAILHQMLTGKDPSESPFHFNPIRSYHPSLSIELETLIAQMLDLDPQKRPDSMLHVKERLEHFLQHAGNYAAGYQAASPLYGNNWATPGYQQPLRQIPYPPLSGTYQQTSNATQNQQQSFYTPPAQGYNAQGQIYYAPSPQAAKPKKGTTRRAVLITAGIMGSAWFFSSQIFLKRADPPVVTQIPTVSPDSSISLNYQTTFTGHTGTVNSMMWANNTYPYVASASDDKTIQTWVPYNADPNNAFICRGHKEAVTTVAWSADNATLASGSLDKTVRLWNSNSGKQEAAVNFPAAIYSVSWNPDGSSLAAACGDGKVYICDYKALRTISTYKGHTKSVRVVAWSSDGSYIASGGEDKNVHIWATTPNALAMTIYRGHSNTINALSWSPGNSQIASGSSDRTVQIWSPTTGDTSILYLGHMTNGTPPPHVDLSESGPAEVYAVAWQPTSSDTSGKLIASAGSNGTLHIWDSTNGKARLIQPNPSGTSVKAIAWSSNGTSIAIAGASQSIFVESLSP